jgi:hypothetical protein
VAGAASSLAARRVSGGKRLPAGMLAVTGAVAARPRLWPAALRQVRSLARPGWWRRPPFVPLPDRDWMAFRLTTAYGDPRAALVPDDVLTWLEWSDTVRPVPPTAAPRRGEGR